VKSGGDFLSRDKLQGLEKKYQESNGGAPSIFSADAKSKVSHAASIAPSKVESKAGVTRLSKIEEESNVDEGHIHKMLRQLHAQDRDGFDQLI
jgi:hypothetical protein